MNKFELLKNRDNEGEVAPKSSIELLQEFKQQEEIEKMPRGERLKFKGVGGKDVYNITAPFEVDGVNYILGRVEPRGSHTDTESMFFIKEEGYWIPDKSKPIFEMQDPFFTKIDDELIVGGVETFRDKNSKSSDEVTWKTVFYKGKNLNDLEKFAEGPEGMKDIRVIKLPNDKIGVFTRPGSLKTREKDGIGGNIGYIEIDSLNELNIENINKAKIIEGFFAKGEWGGVNEVHLLNNGKLGVLGHIAFNGKEKSKHYYGIIFSFDSESKQVSGKKIISTAGCFNDGEVKKESLRDVFYSGGLKIENNEVRIYGGIGDAEAGSKKVGNSLDDLFS